MNRCVLVALGLTLVVAESAMAQGLPTVPVPEVRVPADCLPCRLCPSVPGDPGRSGAPRGPGSASP